MQNTNNYVKEVYILLIIVLTVDKSSEWWKIKWDFKKEESESKWNLMKEESGSKSEWNQKK